MQVVYQEYKDNRGAPGGMATLYVKWTCTDGGIVSEKIGDLLSGKIVELITKPSGTSPPTDNYDVTLVSALSGHDLLEGAGIDRDTANTERQLIFVERTVGVNVYGDNPAVNEAGAVFTIAAAGNATKGETWIIIQ